MVSRQKGGKSFMTLDTGDEPVMPRVIGKGATRIACLSENGRLLVFGLDEIKTQPGGGRGVILMELDLDEKLLSAQPIGPKGVKVVGSGQRSGKPQETNLSGTELTGHVGKRARKGKLLASRMKVERLEALG